MSIKAQEMVMAGKAASCPALENRMKASVPQEPGHKK